MNENIFKTILLELIDENPFAVRGALNFDYLGAKIGQHRRRGRRRDIGGRVHHPQTLQNQLVIDNPVHSVHSIEDRADKPSVWLP